MVEVSEKDIVIAKNFIMNTVAAFGQACVMYGGKKEDCQPVIHYCDETRKEYAIILGVKVKIGKDVYDRFIAALEKAAEELARESKH